MKKFTLLIIATLLMAINVSADDRQFYFLVKESRLGSISSDAKDQSGVYLRWDLVEGDFPSDISSISLVRVEDDTNTTLLSKGSDEIMSEKEIAEMFQDSSAQRRLFETIGFISDNDSEVCADANIANIGEKVTVCLESDYWSFLASRVNFNVAQARYRAFLDTTYNVESSKLEYVLLGHDSDKAQQIVLGRASVKLGSGSSVLPANEFTQVIASQCNDNRYGLDDYKMALSWKNGGQNATEFFANGLMVSGYDIFYYNIPVTDANRVGIKAAEVDIAVIASKEAHDSEGNVDLSEYNLVKANDTLITLGEKDTNGSDPIYVESTKDLKDRDFKPGENRFYFLVAKDFTGNYGPTTFKEVTIPDTLPPAKPINPRVIEKDGGAELIWDSVNFANYSHVYKYDMKACSTDTISTTSRVRFVNENISCSEGKGVEINFNVAKYYVYRFDNSAEAAGFEDLDLDGYNDFFESENEKCNASVPAGITSNLVAIINQTNERTVHFNDEQVEQGKVYWYRVMSVTGSQISSQLTAPLRAFIPKRALLDAPDINFTTTSIVIESQNQEVSGDKFAQDDTDTATRVEIAFTDETFSLAIASNTKLAVLSQSVKSKLFPSTTGAAQLTFYNENRVIKSRVIDIDTTFSFTYVFDEDDKDIYLGRSIVASEKLFTLKEVPAEVIDGIFTPGGCVDMQLEQSFVDELQGNGCLETSIAIGNSRYRHTRDCNVTQNETICVPTLNGDLVSLGVSAVYNNGTSTQVTYVNFVGDNDVNYLQVVNKPNLVGMKVDVGGGTAEVSVSPQVQKVTGTMIYLYNTKDDNTKTTTVTHIGEDDPTQTISAMFDNLDIAIGDTWCAKAKTISWDGRMSKWSTPICKSIFVEGEEVDNLLWPSVDGNIARNADLPINFNDETKKVEIDLASRSENIASMLEYGIDDVEYTTTIAIDVANSIVTDLEIALYVPDEKLPILTASIPKLNNKFDLEGKMEFGKDIDEAQAMTPHIYVARLTFKNAAGLQVFETIELKNDKKDLFIFIEGSYQLLISRQVKISARDIESTCYMRDTVNRHSNYVTYRQSVSDAGVYGNLNQVSPLIEASECKGNVLYKSKNIEISPYGVNMRMVKYIDRYPYIVGEKYRYVLLFFNKETGEPQSYTLTKPEIIEVN